MQTMKTPKNKNKDGKDAGKQWFYLTISLLNWVLKLRSELGP